MSNRQVFSAALEVTQWPDSTHRFSQRVQSYLAARARYPLETAELLAKETGLKPSHFIADIGSGTGFSAEPFLRYGNTVIGVEPNDEMREAGDTLLKEFPLFRSVKGTAEQTGLPDASADYVIAGQSFHWFDVPAARREFKRVLRPGGWVVLMWNLRHFDSGAFNRAYEALLVEHGTDYTKIRDSHARESDIAAFFGGDFTRRAVSNNQRFDYAGLEQRLLSSSYVPAAREAGYQSMLDALARVFEQNQQDGEIVFGQDLELYFGKLA
jgi:SAM-dependent methyltransferase